ncbi:MAG: hypothetical protein AB7U61_18535 [Methylocystis sp.]
MVDQFKRKAVNKRAPAVLWPSLTEHQERAILAVYRGEANAEMQKMAMDWIIKEASRFGEISYDETNERNTTFNEGRRCVGFFLTRILLDPLGTYATVKGNKHA